MKKVIALVTVLVMFVSCDNSTPAVETTVVDTVQVDTTLVPVEDSLLIGENVQ